MGRSGYVRIDIAEIIEEIEDDDLLEEIARRKLLPSASGESLPVELIQEAHRELLVGRASEARIILERLLFPKWKTVDSSKHAYDFFRRKSA